MNRKWINSTVIFLTFLATQASALASVKVGVPLALTGSIAELAVDMKSGAELAASQINEQGGVLQKDYELVFADSACNPDKSVQEVSRLIEDENVIALVGPVCSGTTLRQAKSVSIPAGVVTLSGASA